jgi:putative FmdB family regulatory protein
MPIYAYRCSSCGHAKDVLQKMSDPVLTVCPACGASTFVKQVTAAGFQLKGSGWYVTDFKGGGGAAPAAPEGAKAADADKSGADKSGADKSDGAKSDAAKPDSAPAPAPASTSATPAAAPAAAPAPAPSPGGVAPASGAK